MKTYGDLLNRLSEYYKNEYEPLQSEEIQKYLSETHYPIKALSNLFDLITTNFAPYQGVRLPLKSHIHKWLNKAFNRDSIVAFRSEELHPESPLQQLYRAKDWTVEKILENCRRIRLKQNQIGTDKLLSAEISFLAIWEQLKDVQQEHREIAKKRIVANGDRQLNKPVDLSDLSIYHKSQERDFERKGNVNMQGALEDII